MLTTDVSDRNRPAQSGHLGPHCTAGRSRLSTAARLSRMILFTIAAYFCANLALWAQTSDSQTGGTNQSATAAAGWQSDNVGLTRTTESHTQSGNRTLNKQSVQRRGFDGHFEPFQDIEKETVQVNATTVRTTTRTFGRDANGAKTLMQVTEEEKHILPGGGSNVVRALSYPDGNGNLHLLQRQVEETKNTGKDSEETNTTVMYPSAAGGFTPGLRTQERRKLGANGTVESQKTTLLPDGSGNWQVQEVRQATTRSEGKNSSTEERVSRPDSEGKLGEVSRTVSKESASASGDKRKTVESYSADVAGSTRDGSLHPVERAITVQRTGSAGQQTTEQIVQQPNPANPDAGLQVSAFTADTVRSSPTGEQTTHTVQARDANGSFAVVSVDTTKSDNVHSIQLQMAPSEKPK